MKLSSPKCQQSAQKQRIVKLYICIFTQNFPPLVYGLKQRNLFSADQKNIPIEKLAGLNKNFMP